MDKVKKNILHIFTRYIIVLVLGLGNLYIYYKLLTPITVGTVNLFLSISRETLVIGNMIHFTNLTAIEIIPACVAGSAFYLLTILIFTSPGIKPCKRLKILVYSFLTLFILNVLRMVLLANITSLNSFDAIHWILWNFVSVIMVVGIWVIMAFRYNVRTVPVYTDLKYLVYLIKTGKKAKRRK